MCRSWQPRRAIITKDAISFAFDDEEVEIDHIPLAEVSSIMCIKEAEIGAMESTRILGRNSEKQFDLQEPHALEIATERDGYNSGRVYYLRFDTREILDHVNETLKSNAKDARRRARAHTGFERAQYRVKKVRHPKSTLDTLALQAEASFLPAHKDLQVPHLQVDHQHPDHNGNPPPRPASCSAAAASHSSALLASSRGGARRSPRPTPPGPRRGRGGDGRGAKPPSCHGRITRLAGMAERPSRCRGGAAARREGVRGRGPAERIIPAASSATAAGGARAELRVLHRGVAVRHDIFSIYSLYILYIFSIYSLYILVGRTSCAPSWSRSTSRGLWRVGDTELEKL